jgi:glutathione S-transferase
VNTLWGTGTTRTLRPIWVAEELGLDYELIRMGPRTGETSTPAYTRMAPKQKIPFFRDASVQLSESLAICRYLVAAHPGGPFHVPVTPAGQAKLDEWCCYIYGELDETSLYVMRRHRDLASLYGEAPAAVAASSEYAARHLGIVAQLIGDEETVLPEGFSLADVLLMTCVIWAEAYGVTVPDSLIAYRQRIGVRPAYQRASEINFKQG